VVIIYLCVFVSAFECLFCVADIESRGFSVHWSQMPVRASCLWHWRMCCWGCFGL